MDRKKINIEDIEDGMMTAEDVIGPADSLIIRKDTELEGKHLGLLKAAEIETIEVLVPEGYDKKQKIHINDYPDYVDKLRNATVMVVDDSSLMRHKLNRILSEAGLNVIGEAENGKQAVEKVEELKPSLITLDIEMPEMDGLEALEPLVQASPETKVVMVSSLGDDDRIIESISSGAMDFITKPFDPERVKKTVIATLIVHHP